MMYSVAAIIAHGPAVKEFRLAPQDGAALPAWQPGAHVELSFSSRAGIAHTRAYSIVGQADGLLRIAVQREEGGRGGSRVLHDEFEPGMALAVSAPIDGFTLHPGATRTVLIAGGIGITPLIPMARALETAGASYRLHYLAHEPARLVLADDRRSLGQERVSTWLTGTGGRPDLERLVGPWEPGCELHACGPSALLDAIRAAATAQGWPQQHLHFESFGARVHAGDAALRVNLLQSGITLDVAPGTSILAAMMEAEVFVSYDCQRGECGNCYAGVVAGEPLHRDVCLSAQQRAQGMTPCVSWARGPLLELDL